jgi:DNA mismatch repair protein MutL
MLGEADVQGLIRDLADEIADNDTVDTLESASTALPRPWLVTAQSARAAPQAGRDERIAAPDGGDPGSATCNHGRPTYIS